MTESEATATITVPGGGRCAIDGHGVHQLTVSLLGYRSWRAGEYIQVALPELSTYAREILLTGQCAEAWAKLWPEEEDE